MHCPCIFCERLKIVLTMAIDDPGFQFRTLRSPPGPAQRGARLGRAASQQPNLVFKTRAERPKHTRQSPKASQVVHSRDRCRLLAIVGEADADVASPPMRRHPRSTRSFWWRWRSIVATTCGGVLLAPPFC